MAAKRRVDLVDLVCRTFGRPKMERLLPSLAISRGPYVRLQRRRRRRLSLDDDHDGSPMASLPPISLYILSNLLYLPSGSLFVSFSWLAVVGWWWNWSFGGVEGILAW